LNVNYKISSSFIGDEVVVYIYPRLPIFAASLLAKERATKSIDELFTLSSTLDHPATLYSPTGGSRITKVALRNLQTQVRACAAIYGYPDSPGSKSEFDTACAMVFHKNMEIYPSEASNLGVWTFFTCVILPDIVRWRFPGEEGVTPIERFLGGDRGLRRNTFGRLWWRAYLLHQPYHEHPYLLLDKLTEDELVQITERPSLAGSPLLAKQICLTFLETIEQNPRISRRELIRDTVKRFRRLLPIILFEALDDYLVQNLVEQLFSSSIESLRENR
jgi:hypothetical protein